MKVLNFGSLNLDYVYQMESILVPGETQASKDRKTFCGGKGLNQSIALARAGILVYHAGMIGSDGDVLLEACCENGIHTEFVRRIDGPSGHTVIQVDRSGQNCILLFGGANRSITREFVDSVMHFFERGDILLLQNEINELPYIIDSAYEKGMRIIMNPSPYDEALKECDLTKVSLFLVNEIEGYQLTGKKEKGEILDGFRENYPKAAVVLTLGGEGAVYQDETGRYFQNIYAVDAVDTTAAGDTFTGYFVASIIEGRSVDEGLDISAKAAAIAVSRPGAAASIPLREEVLSSRLS